MTILDAFPQAATSNIRILTTDIDSNVARAGQGRAIGPLPRE